MDNSTITYTIHIATTPEQLWEALTQAESLQKNWGRIESQWTAGARVTEVDDAGKVLWQGEVRESTPPRRLRYTFEVIGLDEPPTEVTFELTPPTTPVAAHTPVVQLTLTQSGFPPDSKLKPDCSRAWTEILSSIKTYVETGSPLPFVWKH